MDVITDAAALPFPDHNPWHTKSAQAQYDNKWINVTEYQVVTPGGSDGIYGKVHFKNVAVGVLPLEDDGTIWLVGQYRYTLNAYSWEIIEGGSPMDENPADAAHRELAEETGLRAARLEHLLTLHLSNSVSDEVAEIYLATGLTPGQAQPEDTEDLRLARIPLEEALQLVQQGRITDAISVAAILHVALLRQREVE